MWGKFGTHPYSASARCPEISIQDMVKFAAIRSGECCEVYGVGVYSSILNFGGRFSATVKKPVFIFRSRNSCNCIAAVSK